MYSGARAKHFAVNAVMIKLDATLVLFIALSTSTQNKNLGKKTSWREFRWEEVTKTSTSGDSAAEAATM
jgi:hypothetical protein